MLWDYGVPVQYGRIIFVGLDRRTSSSTGNQIVLTIQPSNVKSIWRSQYHQS
ncbi:hypothetical protein BO71DRAFT_430740 [Aspergillus ellipticus CBS 707.79]|uniref:Uncharacterized protein n=1 Tax=Aspergillus ellipticus CBS 707.79 TaxID=1448320 RepID=A0A319D8I7_9EURO|nr:hypothetical protein BO71DRAFT_430740 [Aspergillus ellipticus CBS 707.79]